MKIIREIKSKAYTFELTEAELEAAYREVRHQYLLEDAYAHMEEYLEYSDSFIVLETLPDQVWEDMVAAFQQDESVDLPEYDVWQNVCETFVKMLEKEA